MKRTTAMPEGITVKECVNCIEKRLTSLDKVASRRHRAGQSMSAKEVTAAAIRTGRMITAVRRLKILLGVLMIALTLGRAQATDWPMGSPDGGWPMGTPDASYPMDGANAQIANDRANREYQIAHHMIAVGFTSDEVLRAWGKPDEISRSVSDTRVLESWRYKNPYALVWFNNGIVDSIIQ